MSVSIRFASGHIVTFTRKNGEVLIELKDSKGDLIGTESEEALNFLRAMKLVASD